MSRTASLLPWWHYLGAALLAALSGSAAVAVYFVTLDGVGHSLLGTLFLYGGMSALFTVPSAMTVGLLVHFVILHRLSSTGAVTPIVIGAGVGAMTSCAVLAWFGGVAGMSTAVASAGITAGAVAGCAMALTWWAAVLRPEKEEMRA